MTMTGVDLDLFNLISAPNPTKVKTGTRPRAAHEVPLLTATANRMIVMEDATVAPSTVEKSPLDFANEDSPQGITKEDRMTEANAPPKVLRKDRAPACPEQSTRGDVSDLEPLSYAKPHLYSQQDIAQSSRVPTTEIPAGGVATTEVARRNERIQVKEEEIKRLGEEVESLKVVETEVHGLRNQTKNLKTLLEAEVNMKKATEAMNTELTKELESLRAKFSDLQLNNNQLSQQVSTLQAQLRRAFANVVSAGIAKGMSEGLEYGVKQGKAKLDLEAIEAYDPEADDKYIAAIHALKDLKYPLIDQLEKLKDTSLDLIMESLQLESDTREDAP
ncbi:hypothetical protein Tco_1160283 [Tanacetum coccineum]